MSLTCEFVCFVHTQTLRHTSKKKESIEVSYLHLHFLTHGLFIIMYQYISQLATSQPKWNQHVSWCFPSNRTHAKRPTRTMKGRMKYMLFLVFAYCYVYIITYRYIHKKLYALSFYINKKCGRVRASRHQNIFLCYARFFSRELVVKLCGHVSVLFWRVV